jgi:FO synthase
MNVTAKRSALSARLDSGQRLDAETALQLADGGALDDMLTASAELRDRGFGEIVTYSRKIFIPLTQLCRDVCGYCTFAQPPHKGESAYLSLDQVVEMARRGAEAGCKEALFTLGDKPEQRYGKARAELAGLGHGTTIDYLAEAARRVLEETGLLPHINAGVMGAPELARLRQVSVSQGLMLESAAARLSARGGPHFGSPDKVPAVRLAMIDAAGVLRIPFTSGILIGIGETPRERIEALLALREIQDRHGHIQEIIIQPFRAKPGTKMAGAAEPRLEELLWTIAAARLIFGPGTSIQSPPNLTPESIGALVDAGINDWGGVSPVTPDFVNPEAPWPNLDLLDRLTADAGKVLAERLAIYPRYARASEEWLDPRMRPPSLRFLDASGLAREETWRPGSGAPAPSLVRPGGAGGRIPSAISAAISRARSGERLTEGEIARLFEARGPAFHALATAADELRREAAGDTVTYVVNRNINYTNICTYRCGFCAFSKGKTSEALRGKAYLLDHEEVVRRSREAWERGATEVCLQGGIHPSYDGKTYIGICRAVKTALPEMHVHAFSPLEVWHGATTLGLSLRDYLQALKQTGLGTLPGTAAEILDDEVRAQICPDKLTTAQWLNVVETAHEVGIKTTATIMFGHVDSPLHWARHLLRLRDLQARSGGFTEFVPLPFVASEAPLYLKGKCRSGPSLRESILMHAVARLVLHPLFRNIQTSWVKMGPDGAAQALRAGANDLGGTLMNESITRAAGGKNGQEMVPEAMESVIRELGRVPLQRTTLYGRPPEARRRASFDAPPLTPIRSLAPVAS